MWSIVTWILNSRLVALEFLSGHLAKAGQALERELI